MNDTTTEAPVGPPKKQSISTPFTRSAETERLIQRILKCAIGDEVSYEELSGIAGENVTKRARHVLTTARKVCWRDHRVLTGCITRKGIRRLSSDEIVDMGIASVGAINRKSKTAVAKLACADPNELENSNKSRYYTGISMLGAMALFSNRSGKQKVLTAVEERGKLDYSETLRLFV